MSARVQDESYKEGLSFNDLLVVVKLHEPAIFIHEWSAVLLLHNQHQKQSTVPLK
jgi:hypothetical protein